jgi:hypothetical protein
MYSFEPENTHKTKASLTSRASTPRNLRGARGRYSTVWRCQQPSRVLRAPRVQPRRVFPHGADHEGNPGSGEAARELRSPAVRVFIQSTCKIIAGASVVLCMLERSVKMQQVDVGHGGTIAGRGRLSSWISSRWTSTSLAALT